MWFILYQAEGEEDCHSDTVRADDNERSGEANLQVCRYLFCSMELAVQFYYTVLVFLPAFAHVSQLAIQSKDVFLIVKQSYCMFHLFLVTKLRIFNITNIHFHSFIGKFWKLTEAVMWVHLSEGRKYFSESKRAHLIPAKWLWDHIVPFVKGGKFLCLEIDHLSGRLA